MNREDRRAVLAVARVRRQIAAAVDAIVAALGGGGRLFFVGAGTSGRLGVLEAAECPPTFGTPPRLVQAIMAGGRPAVFRSREGAEDDARAAGVRGQREGRDRDGALRAQRAWRRAGASRSRGLPTRGASGIVAEVGGADADRSELEHEEEPAEGEDDRCRGQPEVGAPPEGLFPYAAGPPQFADPVHDTWTTQAGCQADFLKRRP